MSTDLKRKQVDSALCERMRELRESRGATQTDCGVALGVGQSTYAEMESGDLPVRRRELVTLSVLYGLPLDAAFPTFRDPARSFPRQKAA